MNYTCYFCCLFICLATPKNRIAFSNCIWIRLHIMFFENIKAHIHLLLTCYGSDIKTSHLMNSHFLRIFQLIWWLSEPASILNTVFESYIVYLLSHFEQIFLWLTRIYHRIISWWCPILNNLFDYFNLIADLSLIGRKHFNCSMIRALFFWWIFVACNFWGYNNHISSLFSDLIQTRGKPSMMTYFVGCTLRFDGSARRIMIF